MENTIEAGKKLIFMPDRAPPGTLIKDYVHPEILEHLHPHWLNYETIDNMIYFGLGITYLVIGTLAISGNGLVLFMFCKHNTLRKPSNALIINLAVCDLLLMLTLVPFSAVALLCGGTFIYGYNYCIFHAFSGSIFGYGQIMSLVCIANERYSAIVKGMKSKPLTKGRVKTMLIFIWTVSLFWAVGPLFGFGGYAMDGGLVTCSFDYMNRNPINVNYIISCSIFLFICPLLFIGRCYYSIVKAVWEHEHILRDQAKKMNVTSLRSNEKTQLSVEIRIAKVAITNVALWTISWTPYTVVTLIGVIGNQELLTPLATLFPVLMAKISCVYNPIIYAISHPKYKECLKKSFSCFCCSVKESVKADNISTASELTKIQEP